MPHLPGGPAGALARAPANPVLGRRQRRWGALVPPQRLSRRARAAGRFEAGPARLRPPARAGGRESCSPTPSWTTRSASCCCARPGSFSSGPPRRSRRILEADSRILPVTRAFAQVHLRTLDLDERHAAALPRRLSQRDHRARLSRAGRSASLRRARSGPATPSGCCFGDDASGGVCAFVPGCGGLDDALLAAARAGGPGAVRRDLLDRRRADPAPHRRADRAADGPPADLRAGRQPRPPGRAARRGSGSTPTSTTPIPCCSRTAPSGPRSKPPGFAWASTACGLPSSFRP